MARWGHCGGCFRLHPWFAKRHSGGELVHDICTLAVRLCTTARRAVGAPPSLRLPVCLASGLHVLVESNSVGPEYTPGPHHITAFYLQIKIFSLRQFSQHFRIFTRVGTLTLCSCIPDPMLRQSNPKGAVPYAQQPGRSSRDKSHVYHV